MTRRKLDVGDRVRLTSTVTGWAMPGVRYTGREGVGAVVSEIREDGSLVLAVGSSAVSCIADRRDVEHVR